MEIINNMVIIRSKEYGEKVLQVIENFRTDLIIDPAKTGLIVRRTPMEND